MSEPEMKTVDFQAEWTIKITRNRDQLKDTMSYLYLDPANTYITLDDMIVLAKMKIDGNNIDDSLAWARTRQDRLRKLFPARK